MTGWSRAPARTERDPGFPSDPGEGSQIPVKPPQKREDGSIDENQEGRTDQLKLPEPPEYALPPPLPVAGPRPTPWEDRAWKELQRKRKVLWKKTLNDPIIVKSRPGRHAIPGKIADLSWWTTKNVTRESAEAAPGLAYAAAAGAGGAVVGGLVVGGKETVKAGVTVVKTAVDIGKGAVKAGEDFGKKLKRWGSFPGEGPY